MNLAFLYAGTSRQNQTTSQKTTQNLSKTCSQKKKRRDLWHIVVVQCCPHCGEKQMKLFWGPTIWLTCTSENHLFEEKCGTWKHSNTCQWIGSTYSLVLSKQAAGAPNEAKKNSNAAAERFLMKMTRQAKNANIFVFGGIRFCFGSTTSWALRQWNIERLHNGNRIRA